MDPVLKFSNLAKKISFNTCYVAYCIERPHSSITIRFVFLGSVFRIALFDIRATDRLKMDRIIFVAGSYRVICFRKEAFASDSNEASGLSCGCRRASFLRFTWQKCVENRWQTLFYTLGLESLFNAMRPKFDTSERSQQIYWLIEMVPYYSKLIPQNATLASPIMC